MASSRAALSGVSEAWTRFWPVSSAKSPRMLPGAASCGRVAPLMARHTAMALSPSNASATSGAEVMKSTRRAEERLLPMLGVVVLRGLAGGHHELEPDQLQAALLVPLEQAPDQQSLDAVGLDEDEGAFGHVDSLVMARPGRARSAS